MESPLLWIKKNLQPYINEYVKDVIKKVEYLDIKGAAQQGFDCMILPAVCNVYLRARKDGVLLPTQIDTAQKAEILVRSLAKVGIISLVDEATGYQYEREKNELQKILKAYISDEILKWQLTFTDEFYREIFHLWGIPFIPKYTSIPQHYSL